VIALLRDSTLRIMPRFSIPRWAHRLNNWSGKTVGSYGTVPELILIDNNLHNA
jgi:hypothetical protein